MSEWWVFPIVLSILLGITNTGTIFYFVRALEKLEGLSTPAPKRESDCSKRRKGTAK